MHQLQLYIVQSFLRTALTAYRSELHRIFNYIHTKIARDSSNPLISEAQVIAKHSHIQSVLQFCISDQRIKWLSRNTLCARTLCKRTLLENHSSNKYFFHYKTMNKINESVCNYKYLSTMF